MALANNLYELLTDQEDARVCRDLSEDACRDTPKSFVLILTSYLFMKLGDAISNPKTTLAWLATSVGAPAFVLGMLVPIRESGSMLPQLFIGGTIRRLPIRKWVWSLGAVAQCACIAGLGVVALTLEGRSAGWALIALVVVFSVARGFSSVAAKDVVGKTIAKNKRGQLSGWSDSAAGALTIVIGLALMLPAAATNNETTLGILLIGAGLLWLVAAAVYAQIPEEPGDTGGGRNAVDALRRLSLILEDRPFRRFVITRALLMCSALSAPFYVALAQREVGTPAVLLGAFVLASGIASLVSAPVWGRFADRSSKWVMIAAALITAGIGLVTFALARLAPGLTGTLWFLPSAYFVLMVAHSGVRVGRQTYIVNLGTGNQRTDYVAVSNTLIGVLLLVVGSVGALAVYIGADGVLGLLALMGLAGAALGTTLPDVERD
ncbi:MAG: MFS transporter [Pseudomonadota bacterium]